MLRVFSCNGIGVIQTEGFRPSEVIFVVFGKGYVKTSISHELEDKNSINGRYNFVSCQ